MEWISKIPNWIKIPIKVLLPALAIFSGFIMLSNDLLLEKLYLTELRQTYGFIFGTIFIICLSLIIAYTFVYIIEKAINKLKFNIYKKRRIKTIESLPQIAKDMLISMYKSNSRTKELECSNANTTLLINQEMIGCPQVSTFGMFFSFFLQPWVVEYFDNQIKNYKLLLKRLEKVLLKQKNSESREKLIMMKDECEQKIKFLTDKIDSKSIRQEWLGW